MNFNYEPYKGFYFAFPDGITFINGKPLHVKMVATFSQEVFVKVPYDPAKHGASISIPIEEFVYERRENEYQIIEVGEPDNCYEKIKQRIDELGEIKPYVFPK